MSDRFSGSKLNDWNAQSKNPAAPAGQQAAARAAGGYESGDNRFADSQLGKWTSQNGYVAQSKSWYTGANPDGTNNGWDSAFADKFIKGQDAAAKAGRLSTYFDDADATGVVTWDHTSKDGSREYKFGDVYEDGKKVSNVYDQFDKSTADLMMTDWTMDGKTKAKIFSASDAMDRLGREMDQLRESNRTEMPKRLAAIEFEDKVSKREKEFTEGAGDEAIVAGGAAGGAALGAGIGSIVPGLGTLAGGGLGALVGGAAAYLNKDQLTEQAARAYEITAASARDENGLAGFFTGVQQWAGVAGKELSPLSNLVQGSADIGHIGDGQSEFYRVDDKGDRQVSKFLRAADIGASIGDALLQFSNPLGVALYTGQMSATIGGEVGSLIASGGKTWDDRRGGFDSIFTDDKGHFDLGAAAAGIGNIGIDVVQLGMARGLVGKADASMRAIGEQGTYGTGRFAARLPEWAGGRSQLTKDTIAAGGREHEAAGYKFLLDSGGNVVSKRATLSLLAPSEQLAAVSAKAIARRTAAVERGATKADDFYKAANDMATGERKFTTALVTGLGEGYEEVVQGLLEPRSHNASPDGDSLIQAFIGGATAGVGMGLGTALHTSTADQKMFALAKVNHAARTGGAELDKKDWESMDDFQKRVLSSTSGVGGAVMQAAYDKYIDDQSTEMVAGVVGANRLADSITDAMTLAMNKLTTRTAGAFVIQQHEDVGRLDADGNIDPADPSTVPSNAVVASGLQTLKNLNDHLRGIAVQRSDIERALTELQANAPAPDAEDADHATRVADLTRQLAAVELSLQWGTRLQNDLDTRVNRLYDPAATPESIEAEVAAINSGLRNAFAEIDPTAGQEMTPEDLRAVSRSVSMLFGRDPHADSGSYQMLVPQVSAKLTMANADNVLQVSHAILPAIRGDFDGDKMRPLNQLILDDEAFISARSGAHFLGAGGYVNVGRTKYEGKLMGLLAQSLAGPSSTLKNFAEGTLITIGTTIRKRYAGAVNTDSLDRVLESFFRAARSNTKDAGSVLLDGLATNLGGEITEFSRDHLSDEWLWIDQLIKSTLTRFQESYAAHRPDIGPKPDYVGAQPNKQEPNVRTRNAARAATLGQQMSQSLPGDSLFRKFQKLHYTSINSPVLSAEFAGEQTSLMEMAQFYEALGQDLTQSQLDQIRSMDAVTGRVYGKLLDLANDFSRLNPGFSPVQALPIVANLEVRDVDWDIDTDTYVDNEKVISLAQLLLRRSVEQDARNKDVILEASPELKAKHTRLLAMTRPGGRGNSNPVNAERAFVEVVGSQQLFNLLGDDANIFGPHLTVEQYIRYFASLDTDARADLVRSSLHKESAYLGKKQAKDMPYTLDDIGEISAYRAVVDAIVAVGNHRIAIDKATGKLTGELAEKSDRSSADFQHAHGVARQAIQQFLGLSPRKDGELTEEVVQRLLEGNPDFAAKVMGLIPNSAAQAVFEIRDDNVWIANWVYKMFTMDDAKEAEMHFWRNTKLAQWIALDVLNDGEPGVEGESARRFDRMPSRLHRIMYKLALEPDGGLLYAEFFQKMQEATDLQSFLKWVNTTAGIRGAQAPLTAWVDDPAEFDADKSNGGWTTVLQGAEMREAISALRDSTERLVKSLSEEKAALNADIQTLQAIRRVVRAEKGDPNVKLDTGDRELHDQLEKSIDLAGELMIGLGPQALIFQGVGAVRGFYPHGHTKGENPDNVEAFGAFDAVRDAYDYVTNAERVLGSLTSVNLDAIGSNMSQLAKDGVRSMDDFGRVIEWTKPTVEQMLDMLEDPDSRPAARALLFPQVMERTSDGRLSPQMLIGKTLRDLLNGKAVNDLFPKNGRLSQDQALRYAAMLNAQARQHDGHVALSRAVNDYVVAQTSAATSVLTAADEEAMYVGGLREYSGLLQLIGSIASAPAEQHRLAEILKTAKDTARAAQLRGALGVSAEDRDYTGTVLDTLVSDREFELEREVAELVDLQASNPANLEALTAQVEMAKADLEQFKSRIELLRADDQVGMVVSMFSIPTDPIEAVAKKKAVVEYIQTHLGIVERVSSNFMVFDKLTQQLLDSGRTGDLDLSEAEWKALSDSVISDYLHQAAGRAGNNISLSPFPDADHADDQRYFDTSFSYLLDPLFDIDGPLVKAAVDLHRMAGRQAEVATSSEVLEMIDRTIFADFKLGRWTGDIPRASVTANERLDSAAAAPAIAMAGNAPKRQGVISAATRRTFIKPDDTQLSTAQLSLQLISRGLHDDVAVNFPGSTAAVLRPLVELNNRFAASAIATFPDGSTIDLLTSTDVGRRWQGESSVRESGYQEIHLSRLQQAIIAEATRLKVDPNDVTVDLSFFHPETQPSSSEWYNNIYFEGTSFLLDADRQASLNATLWFANESISPAAQAQALDASKLGELALKVIKTPTAAERFQMEIPWATDLAQVLRAKARAVFDSDAGLDESEFYNAIYKNLKLRHFVQGSVNGVATLWTAEQVLEFQLANPGAPLPLEGAKLYVPTDDVLRSMLGEQGTQGVARVFNDQLDFDLANVPTYRGVSDTMLERFREGIEGGTVDLMQTRIANRAHQSQLVVRAMIDKKARAAYEIRMKYFKSKKDDIWAERGDLPGRGDATFSTRANLSRALDVGDKMLRAANIAFDWTGAGIPFIGPRKPSDSTLSTMLLQDLAASLDKENASRTGWIYREGAEANPLEGLLTEVSLGKERKGMRVAPDDLVVVEVDSFRGNGELGRKRLDHFADNGAIIVLGNVDGQGDLRAELANHLESNGYERVAGSGHVYKPADLGSRFQNPRALASTLLETRGISTRNMLSILNLEDHAIEENAAWANSYNERLRAISVTMNLVPTDAFAGYNVPVEQFSNESQIEKVRAHMRGFDTAEGRSFLADIATASLDEAEKAEAAIEFDAAFTRMIQRFDATPGTVLPQPGDEFNIGDIIPLIDPTGSRVMLYRHGFKAPRDREELNRQQALTRSGSLDASNVAIYSSKREDTATVHSGTVVRFVPRSGYGLQVELNVPLQVFGAKFQLEWNGMKYLITPRPDSLVTPDHGILGDWGIDLFASAHDAASKESVGGMVNNHRNAFAYFGIDFMDDLKTFFGTDEGGVREILRATANSAEPLTLAAASELLSSNRLGAAFTEKLMTFSAEQQDRLGDTSWIDRVNEPSVEAQIARAMLVTLMVPGVKVEDVLRSGGFNDESTSVDSQSRLMPRLFTQIFDDAALDSDLRKEMNRRFNAQINNAPGRAAGTGYRLHTNWTFEVINADKSKNLRGYLQYSEAHSSSDNPVKNGMAFDDKAPAAVSAHSAAVAYQAIDARTASLSDLSRVRLLNQGITRFEKDKADGGVWRALTSVGADPRQVAWRMDTPAEAEARSLSRDAMIQFRQPIDKTTDNGWSDKQRNDYAELAQTIVQRLGLKANQLGLVDGWVRQFLGMPEGLNEDGQQHHVSGKQAIAAAVEIQWNVDNNYLPTIGGYVPLNDVHDLQAIYRANRGKDKGWSPRIDTDATTAQSNTWSDWVNVSLGGALASTQEFDPLYLTALDGFMHTYQNATESLLDLPVSFDALKAQDLLTPENNRLITSLDPNTQQRLTEPALLNSERATINDLLGGQRVAGRYLNKMAPASEIAKRLQTHKKWRAENGVPIPLPVTMKDFRKNGAEFVQHGTTTNALVRSLINLRVGTALINPALWISMGPEVMIRGAIDKMANLATGQSTVGFAARRSAAASEWLAGTSMGDAFERMGLTYRYTPEQIQKLNVLYDSLGRRTEFKRMIFADLNFLRPHADGIGWFEKKTEAYARFGSRMQDPTYGPRARTLAFRYMEAAMEHINARPMVNPISIDTLIAEMTTNPLFLQRNYPEAHKAGSNAIAQARSLKATPLSLALKGIYEPMSDSTNAFVNVTSNILVKLPLLFSSYAMNVVTQVTGMQGLSDFTAMFIDGRNKPGFIRRIQAAMRGIPMETYEAEFGTTFDMSEVIEGIDLTRSFLRGGITHTGLMALGLAAGGLGLTGEDDEERRRRRAAELQGVPFVYDPRKMQNDFRNADAVWWKGGAFQMPWIAKQFVSPIIGMERFFDTGDPRHIMWGFEDALGSFPIINQSSWFDAVSTAQDFLTSADDAANKGDAAGLVHSHNLLTSMVGSYERMLFENAFVNQLYQASDRYDRDPYAQPLLDSDETTQVDASGQPRETTALRQYFDDQGRLKEGFEGRSSASGTLHALTENRATLAGVLSIFTGFGDSSFFRRNMVTKTRSFEAPVASDDEAMAVVKALRMKEAAGPLNVTADEALDILRNQGVGGQYARNSELEPLAEKMSAGSGFAPLSILNDQDREILTKDGARAVFQGLAKGSVTLDSPSLAGIHITYDQRNEIAAEWMQDLIQEGLDMGLDQTKATSRMKRLWSGPLDQPGVKGLGDILFAKEISYSDKLEYNQLNTTFVKGPDGMPWATGFGRSALFGSIKPMKQIIPDTGFDGQPVGIMSVDERMNSVDLAAGQNLGLRALEPVHEKIPTDVEIAKSITDAMEKAASQNYTPFTPYASTSGGYSGGGGGYGGYSGGGGAYAPNMYWTRMNPFPDQRAPYANGIPFINTSNPILRRSDVRRERVWSERGRLKQWQ